MPRSAIARHRLFRQRSFSTPSLGRTMIQARRLLLDGNAGNAALRPACPAPFWGNAMNQRRKLDRENAPIPRRKAPVATPAPLESLGRKADEAHYVTTSRTWPEEPGKEESATPLAQPTRAQHASMRREPTASQRRTSANSRTRPPRSQNTRSSIPTTLRW